MTNPLDEDLEWWTFVVNVPLADEDEAKVVEADIEAALVGRVCVVDKYLDEEMNVN